MRQSLKGSIVFLLFMLMPAKAWAGELRISDSQGLVRLAEEVSSEVTVVVHLAREHPFGTIRLSNVSGLAGDIDGMKIDERTFSFSGVPEGNWKITSAGAPIRVTKVIRQ